MENPRYRRRPGGSPSWPYAGRTGDAGLVEDSMGGNGLCDLRHGWAGARSGDDGPDPDKRFGLFVSLMSSVVSGLLNFLLILFGGWLFLDVTQAPLPLESRSPNPPSLF